MASVPWRSLLAHLYDVNEIIYCGILLEQQVAIVDFILLQGGNKHISVWPQSAQHACSKTLTHGPSEPAQFAAIRGERCLPEGCA